MGIFCGCLSKLHALLLGYASIRKLHTAPRSKCVHSLSRESRNNLASRPFDVTYTFAICCSWRHSPMLLFLNRLPCCFWFVKSHNATTAPWVLLLLFNRLQRKVCTPLSSTDRPALPLLFRPKSARGSPFALHIVESCSRTQLRELFRFNPLSLFRVRSIGDCLQRAD
jgi:hypothetical protein